MKRIFAILISIILILGTVVSCARADRETPQDGTKDGTDDTGLTKEEISLSVWHIATDAKRREAVQRAIKRFEDRYPNIDVVETAVENDPYKTKLSTAMAANQEPDIFISWGGGWLKEFVDEGKVLDIDAKINEIKDEYYESALSLFEINGKKYGLPYSVGPTPVYYNRQIYEKLNLKVPETLSEFESNCDILKENGYIPLALANASQWPGALTFIHLSLKYGGADTFLNAFNRTNGVTFEDESFIKAGRKIQEWVKKGYYPDGANAINYDTGGSRMLFYSGQAAMIIQTNGLVANCRSEAPEFYENNLGLFPFPVIEGGKGTAKEILGGGNAYSIAASTKYPKEAFELIHRLTDKEYGQDAIDIASTVSGVKDVNIKDPLIQQVRDILLNATYIQNYYDQFLPGELANLHKQTTYDLFGLTTTPEKAAADMEAKAREILGPPK